LQTGDPAFGSRLQRGDTSIGEINPIIRLMNSAASAGVKRKSVARISAAGYGHANEPKRRDGSARGDDQVPAAAGARSERKGLDPLVENQ
jgi:hypothetical protein